jgi:hypothetical protein
MLLEYLVRRRLEYWYLVLAHSFVNPAVRPFNKQEAMGIVWLPGTSTGTCRYSSKLLLVSFLLAVSQQEPSNFARRPARLNFTILSYRQTANRHQNKT